jgi:hypothetical protein
VPRTRQAGQTSRRSVAGRWQEPASGLGDCHGERRQISGLPTAARERIAARFWQASPAAIAHACTRVRLVIPPTLGRLNRHLAQCFFTTSLLAEAHAHRQERCRVAGEPQTRADRRAARNGMPAAMTIIAAAACGIDAVGLCAAIVVGRLWRSVSLQVCGRACWLIWEGTWVERGASATAGERGPRRLCVCLVDCDAAVTASQGAWEMLMLASDVLPCKSQGSLRHDGLYLLGSSRGRIGPAASNKGRTTQRPSRWAAACGPRRAYSLARPSGDSRCNMAFFLPVRRSAR